VLLDVLDVLLLQCAVGLAEPPAAWSLLLNTLFSLVAEVSAKTQLDAEEDSRPGKCH